MVDTADIVSVKGLSKGYMDGEQHIAVLRELDLCLPAGRSLAITGPSGSGKSTLLNILAGLIDSDAGRVELQLGDTRHRLHAASVAQRTALRRRAIGYVFQFFNLVPTLTALENVCLPAHLNGRRDMRPRAIALLQEFGLGTRLQAFPEVLSGGEQQRVAVARALLMEPPLVLADEPTGNLDATHSAQVSTLLFNTAQRYGGSVIVATHSETVARDADHHLQLLGPGEAHFA